MAKSHPSHASKPGLILRKFSLSAAVVMAFAAYGLHERSSTPEAGTPSLSSTSSQAASQPTKQAAAASKVAHVPSQAAPTATPNGLYKDGQYTGNVVNVYYGLVQVQATVQNGQVTDVQFLQYPTDRRTSRYINSQATPWLRTEAIQAQTSKVNLISGATLTSEGFVMSLQSALQQAAN